MVFRRRGSDLSPPCLACEVLRDRKDGGDAGREIEARQKSTSIGLENILLSLFVSASHLRGIHGYPDASGLGRCPARRKVRSEQRRHVTVREQRCDAMRSTTQTYTARRTNRLKSTPFPPVICRRQHNRRRGTAPRQAPHLCLGQLERIGRHLHLLNALLQLLHARAATALVLPLTLGPARVSGEVRAARRLSLWSSRTLAGPAEFGSFRAGLYRFGRTQ